MRGQLIGFMIKHTMERLLPSLFTFLCFAIVSSDLMAKPNLTTDSICPVIKIDVDTMPRLTVPRSGCAIFTVGEEIVVAGGHTTGFVPLNTAEYYADGKWHLMQMTYEHDHALLCTMKSGKVLIAGGSEKSLGIGQTFPAELYDPDKHSFEGFGCLDQKRTFATATEIDSGKIIISGNWYAGDSIECFDGEKSFSFVKKVYTSRSCPYILRCARDDVMILSSRDNRGNILNSTKADCLKGEPFDIPLLETWHVKIFLWPFQSLTCFIGDEDKGIYEYLIPVENDYGQLAIMKTRGRECFILETAGSIPMKSPFDTNIEYYSSVIVDRNRNRAYIIGSDKQKHLYVLRADYAEDKKGMGAPLTLYYTDPMPYQISTVPILTKGGDLVFAGGIIDSNFYPLADVFVLHFNDEKNATSQKEALSCWLWIALTLVVLGVFVICVYFRRKQTVMTDAAISAPDTKDDALMRRINDLMTEKKIFLDCNLKINDVAKILETSGRNVSECIRNHYNCTFSYFINRYRIEEAKVILRDNASMKITAVYMESGFSNETSFFRTFRQFTGMTPREWQIQQD